MKKSPFTSISDEQVAHKLIHLSSLKGYIHGVSYYELVSLFGEPIFSQPSGDNKVTKEWVIEFKNEFGDTNVFTIYDWKTYDENYTMNSLTTWNVGGHKSAFEFIDAVETKIKK